MLEHQPFAGEPNADFRARIARRQAEAAEVRQRELLEQTSVINTPEVRIRIWERLHEITMPRDGAHRLLAVIAAQTGLTMAQVQAELQNRANPVAPAVPAAQLAAAGEASAPGGPAAAGEPPGATAS